MTFSRRTSVLLAVAMTIACVVAAVFFRCRAPLLHRAVYDNDLATLEAALTDGDTGSAWSECGPTVPKRFWPIHLACFLNRVECVRMLAAHGCDLNAFDGYGQAPLMMTGNLSLEAAKVLIAYGASLDIKDRFGRTALQHAVNQDAHDLADLLLSSGASGTYGDGEVTRLHVLAMREKDQNLEAARERIDDLMALGIDPRTRSNGGRTAADIAAHRGNPAIAEVLRAKEAGARESPKSRGDR